VTTEPRLLGAVLAGGKSRRFGRDKASEILDGEPLAARAARTLASVFEDVVIVSSSVPASTGSWLRVPDLREGCGPLAGLESSLAHAEAEGWDGVFLLACDLPLVTTDLVRAVADGLGSADAAVATKKGAPHHEPLCGAYRCRCLDAVRGLLDRNELAAQGVISRVQAVLVEADPAAFLNINTPADHEHAGVILGSGDA
jgi:molybdopterin-guanine dinucleotide biosynthesis protein A